MPTTMIQPVRPLGPAVAGIGTTGAARVRRRWRVSIRDRSAGVATLELLDARERDGLTEMARRDGRASVAIDAVDESTDSRRN